MIERSAQDRRLAELSVGIPLDVRQASSRHRRWWNAAVGACPAMLGSMLASRRLESSLGILMYHRVARRVRGVAEPTQNVTPERFAAQLKGLLARGFEPWTLGNALDRMRKGEVTGRRAFVVTFDDGYENLYHQAWPILKELEIPVTIFVATAYLDTDRPFPFDDWIAAGSPAVPDEVWRPLRTWQCAEMLESGLIELGTHTHIHADFRGAPAALVEDLERSLAVLRAAFGLTEIPFAFPYGRTTMGFASATLARAAKETGVTCSLTSEGGLIHPGDDPYAWGRFTAAEIDTGATLAAKLDGRYERIRDSWRNFCQRRPTRLCIESCRLLTAAVGALRRSTAGISAATPMEERVP